VYINMSKVYEFHDIFIKTCEYKDGVGDCKKTRESKKCVDGVCEKINIPETKLDVLENYYSQIQRGGGKGIYKCDKCDKTYTTTSGLRYHKLKHDKTIFKCPEKKCYYSTSKFDKFKKHVEKHGSSSSSSEPDSVLGRKSNNLEELDRQWFEMQKDFGQTGQGSDKPHPTNKALYNYVKQLANKKFQSKSGIYRSSWIVREYKKRGGKYSGKKTSSSGLKRWYKEKWVDLNRPIRNSKGKIIGYKSCGRSKVKGSKNKYPLCRPSKRVNKGTPRTYHSISSKSISRAKKAKSRIKSKGNIKFGSGKQEGGGDPKLKKKLIHSFLKKTCPKCLKVVRGDRNTHMKKHLQEHLPTKKRKISLEEFIDTKKQKGQGQSGGESDCDMCQLGSGKIRSQYHGRKSKIMVRVPINVKNVALYSFKLKKLGFGGGMETGWKRAKQLATKDSIPIEDLKYMRAWFARHLYASYPSYKMWKKAGRPKDSKWHKKHGIISWIIWSADAGFKWVNSQKNINLLNKHFNKNYKSMKLPK
jgi:hypothetical protein